MNWAALTTGNELVTGVGVDDNPNVLLDMANVRGFYLQAPNQINSQFIVAPQLDLGERLGFKWLGEANFSESTGDIHYFGRYWVPRIENPAGDVSLTVWPRGLIVVMTTGSDEFVAATVNDLEQVWQRTLPT